MEIYYTAPSPTMATTVRLENETSEDDSASTVGVALGCAIAGVALFLIKYEDTDGNYRWQQQLQLYCHTL